MIIANLRCENYSFLKSLLAVKYVTKQDDFISNEQLSIIDATLCKVLLVDNLKKLECATLNKEFI